MQSAVKLNVIVPESHRLEIELPDDLPPGPAEVIVLAAHKKKIPHGSMGMDVGKGWVADDFDDPLPADLQALFEGRS